MSVNVNFNARITKAKRPTGSAAALSILTRAGALALVVAATLGVAACGQHETALRKAGGSQAASPPELIGARPGAGSGAPASSKPPGPAAKLPLPEAVRRQLGDLYFASQRGEHPLETRDRVIGPSDVSYGVVYSGKSGDGTYYAVGATGFTDNPVSREGGPHVWRKQPGGAWTYVGDTGGTVCAKVPRELYVLWGFTAKYGDYALCGV